MATTLPPAGDPNTLYVLDLSGYVFRAYHGLPALSNSKGEPTHATRGFAQMLNRLVREVRPQYLAIAMDSDSERGFRKKIYPQYKATRPDPPPDLAKQMVRCRELAEAYAIPALMADEYEADDVIAAIVRQAREKNLRVVIGSADKDLMQLVTPDVLLWDAMRDRVFGPEEVKEKWGVPPERVCDLLALMGDTSDNVPGVQGIGEKTAAKLLTDFGSLDGVFANIDKLKGKQKENLQRDESNARMSYKLVVLAADAPVKVDLEKVKYGGWDGTKVRALLRELEFNKLLEAFDAANAKAAPAAPPPPPPEDGALRVFAGEGAKQRMYECVLTEKALDQAIEACTQAGVFAVDTETTSIDAWNAALVGISLAWKPLHAVYIPVGHRVLGGPKQLPMQLVLEKLRPLFANEKIKKVGHNIKYDDLVLRRAGLPVKGYDFDTMMGSYLLDPERFSHRLDELAHLELHVKTIPYDEVTKKARGKQMGFDEVALDAATRYSGEDADLTRELSALLRPRVEDAALTKLMTEVEVPLALVLSRMEENGVHLDVGVLRALDAEVTKELARLEKELHALAGKDFNVNSPRQLETILFDELKLPVLKRTKTSRSTDHEVLEELAEKHELPKKIVEHRSLAKLKGTYLETLPEQLDKKTGRIHTSYNQAVAATGRLSSNNPNLQNIPARTELGRRIRKAFSAPTGHKLFSADYSQIELRVLAHLSEDTILLDAFRSNQDIHTRTAMELYKVSAEGVTREMRSRAKTVNFAVIYGQGEAALARQLSIPRDEAAKFIADYFKTFPGLAAFLERIVTEARAGEGVRTELGRRRFLPNINSENRGLRAQAERVAKNTPIQGTAADLMKVAMVRIQELLDKQKLATKMILTVHDELVFEVPTGEEKTVEKLVKETMEGVWKLRVPLVVEVGWGADWGEAH